MPKTLQFNDGGWRKKIPSRVLKKVYEIDCTYFMIIEVFFGTNNF